MGQQFTKKYELYDLYVIGERFNQFANNKNVLTVSQLLNLIKTQNSNSILKSYQLHAGQGLTDADDRRIVNLIHERGLTQQFIFNDSLFPSFRAPAYMTHKHQNKNTMISEPFQLLSNNQFEAYLMIDENCAEISDHLTGQHIQGAVLMEAARQMTLAVTEKFFIDEDSRNQLSFISNQVTTNFYQYAFPLEIKIHYDIKKHRGRIKQNSQFVVLVTFFQNNELISEVTYDFSVLNKAYIYEKEKTAAETAIVKASSRGVWRHEPTLAVA